MPQVRTLALFPNAKEYLTDPEGNSCPPSARAINANGFSVPPAGYGPQCVWTPMTLKRAMFYLWRVKQMQVAINLQWDDTEEPTSYAAEFTFTAHNRITPFSSIFASELDKVCNVGNLIGLDQSENPSYEDSEPEAWRARFAIGASSIIGGVRTWINYPSTPEQKYTWPARVRIDYESGDTVNNQTIYVPIWCDISLRSLGSSPFLTSGDSTLSTSGNVQNVNLKVSDKLNLLDGATIYDKPFQYGSSVASVNIRGTVEAYPAALWDYSD